MKKLNICHFSTCVAFFIFLFIFWGILALGHGIVLGELWEKDEEEDRGSNPQAGRPVARGRALSG